MMQYITHVSIPVSVYHILFKWGPFAILNEPVQSGELWPYKLYISGCWYDLGRSRSSQLSTYGTVYVLNWIIIFRCWGHLNIRCPYNIANFKLQSYAVLGNNNDAFVYHCIPSKMFWKNIDMHWALNIAHNPNFRHRGLGSSIVVRL